MVEATGQTQEKDGEKMEDVEFESLPINVEPGA